VSKRGISGGQNPSPVSLFQRKTPIPQNRVFKRGISGGQNPSPVSLFLRETPIPQNRVFKRGAAPLLTIFPLSK
jgi:hypothetical protein